MSTLNQCADYALTLPVSLNTFDTVRTVFKGWAKKWCFQREAGDENGYDHWQCQISLIKKRRLQEILPKLVNAGLKFGKMSPLSAEGRENIYCMKEDTKIEGPWKDTDPDPPPFTKQLEQIQELYPWQKTIITMLKDWDARSIDVIYDPVGNIGKSGFCEYLEYHGHAYEIPMMRLMEDIMQCVYDVPTHKCYLIDMPRAMKKDKLFDFYSGIECLKNGQVYDKRYKFKKRRMNRPRVFIFTNNVPPESMMSRDRWDVWQVLDRKLHTYACVKTESEQEVTADDATADASAQASV